MKYIIINIIGELLIVAVFPIERIEIFPFGGVESWRTPYLLYTNIIQILKAFCNDWVSVFISSGIVTPYIYKKNNAMY